MKYVKGPDFPTGGIIIGKEIREQAYRTGRGSFRLRCKWEIEDLGRGAVANRGYRDSLSGAEVKTD